MFVVGEVSGDAHAAHLAESLRAIAPHTEFEFFGSTGEKLRAAGVETIVRADDLAIIGLPEIARALPMFWRTFQTLKKTAAERRPDAVVLVDFPEFNLKLAKSLRKLGLRVIYYISPQLWAWRKYRKISVKRDIDQLLTILPFEKDWYARHGINNVEYVGNPLAGEVYAKFGRDELCQKYNLDAQRPIIALLAGSRRKEIEKILPKMLETAAYLNKKRRDLQFVSPLAPTRKLVEFENAVKSATEAKLKLPKDLIAVQNVTREAVSAADVAVVASGTATLETAILGTPLVVVYQATAFNYKIIRPLIDVPHFGLVNLVAQKRLAKEFIQEDFTAENVGNEILRLLEPTNNKAMREELRAVTETLGKGASKNAAKAILETLSKFLPQQKADLQL